MGENWSMQKYNEVQPGCHDFLRLGIKLQTIWLNTQCGQVSRMASERPLRPKDEGAADMISS